MNTNEQCDRVALKMTASYAAGEYNVDLEIEADEDGLMLDNGVFIPWTWIDAARQALRSPTCTFERSYPLIDISSHENEVVS